MLLECKCKARHWSCAPAEVLGLGTHISDEMLPSYQTAVESLFDLLDVHHTDTLGIEEFVTGLLKVTGVCHTFRLVRFVSNESSARILGGLKR